MNSTQIPTQVVCIYNHFLLDVLMTMLSLIQPTSNRSLLSIHCYALIKVTLADFFLPLRCNHPCKTAGFWILLPPFHLNKCRTERSHTSSCALSGNYPARSPLSHWSCLSNYRLLRLRLASSFSRPDLCKQGDMHTQMSMHAHRVVEFAGELQTHHPFAEFTLDNFKQVFCSTTNSWACRKKTKIRGN